MKKCDYCGLENPDDAITCSACGMDAFVGQKPQAVGGHIISPEEERFWQRMTFRQFAVFLIRLQAVWMLFNAIDVATHLPSYFQGASYLRSSLPIYTQISLSAILAILRVAWYLAGAIVCIRYADRIVSWFVKDMLPKQPAPEKTDERSGPR